MPTIQGVLNKIPRDHSVFGLQDLQHFKHDLLSLFGLFCCFLSARLIGHAEFVDHVLPLRSAVARAIYQTAELSDRPRVRLNHTHNEHP